jgi:peptidyl-prolyl cis-trans isomerase SurA
MKQSGSGRFLLVAAVAAALAFLPKAAVEAQSQPQQQVIQKIEALVNDQVISAYDVGQRMGLILLATGQTVQSQQQLDQLRKQVLENLIDERLEMQEATEYEVPAPDPEIEAAYARVAANYNRTPENFAKLLEQFGSSRDTILEQIRAEYKWQTLVNGRYGSYVTATDEEVDEYLANMQANAGKQEYRVSEIYLSVPDPSVESIIAERATKIREQMQGFQQFTAFARQFSQSTSAAQGGDLGWIGDDQMPPEIAAVVRGADIYDISQPIHTPGGYYIVAVTDRRKILENDPMDEKLSLKQITYLFTPQTTEASANAWADHADTVVAKFTSCTDLAETIRALGEGVVVRDLGDVSLKQINPELRKIIEPMKTNSMTEPLNASDGFVMFVVCDRRMPEAKLPSREEVAQQLEQQRIAMMGRRYLRDLRRDAIIEYK